MTERDLQTEIAAFLARGPATGAAIAMGIRVRRAVVDEALLAGPFVEAPAPEGANPRARHWQTAPISSQPVPGGKTRAAAMLSVLADGRKRSRDEIFEAAGRFFLTNNAASELRAKGYDVRQGREGKLYVYWLVSARSSAAAARARRGASVSKPHSAVAA